MMGFICTGDGICVYVSKDFGIVCDDDNECIESIICGKEVDVGVCVFDFDNFIVKSGEFCNDDDFIIFNDFCFLDGFCVGTFCACTIFGFCEKADGYSCDMDGMCIYFVKNENDVCDNSDLCIYIDVCVTDGGIGKLECVGVEYSCDDFVVIDG